MSKPNIYNLLVLGKVGIGKSAMVRLLTGRQDCLSSSQKKSHTKNAKMYNSVLQPQEQGFLINVIDTPGLDENNIQQNSIREEILRSLSNVQLNGILYLIELRGRDNELIKKILRFIRNLPYRYDKLVRSIIPVITFYDEIILMDLDDEEIEQNEREWQKEFLELEMGQVWSNRIRWMNNTRNLQKHLKNMRISSLYNQQKSKLKQKIDKISLKFNYQKYQRQMIKRLIQLIKQLQLTQQLGKSQLQITQDTQFYFRQNSLKQQMQIIPQIFTEFKQFYISEEIGLAEKIIYSPLVMAYLGFLTVISPCKAIYEYMKSYYKIDKRGLNQNLDRCGRYEQLLRKIISYEIIKNDIIQLRMQNKEIQLRFNEQKMRQICRFQNVVIQYEFMNENAQRLDECQQRRLKMRLTHENNYRGYIRLHKKDIINKMCKIRCNLKCFLSRADQLNKYIENNYYQKINKFIIFQ